MNNTSPALTNLQTRLTESVFISCLNNISASPASFFLFFGGIVGLSEGLYSSAEANKFAFFTTSKLTGDTIILRMLNVIISVGMRANWYSNFGEAVIVLRNVFSSDNEAEPLTLENFQQNVNKLTNKNIGHVTGLCVGICIFLYLMSQLQHQTWAELFKPVDYSEANSSENINTSIMRSFDQAILIPGGLANLYSYGGSWIDSLTNKSTLFHAISCCKKLEEHNLEKIPRTSIEMLEI